MSDLISRQAAIDALHKKRIETMEKGQDVNHIWECLDVAAQVPSAQQWTPCSERLPKKGMRAVLLYSNEKISGGVYMGDRTWNVDYNDTDLSVYIVAWMPLPEPYKGEES